MLQIPSHFLTRTSLPLFNPPIPLSGLIIRFTILNDPPLAQLRRTRGWQLLRQSHPDLQHHLLLQPPAQGFRPVEAEQPPRWRPPPAAHRSGGGPGLQGAGKPQASFCAMPQDREDLAQD